MLFGDSGRLRADTKGVNETSKDILVLTPSQGHDITASVQVNAQRKLTALDSNVRPFESTNRSYEHKRNLRKKEKTMIRLLNG